MKILERDTDGIKKYREDLLGTADKMIYPDVYSELSAANKRNIAWGDWKAMKLRDKAFMIANDAVANMIEIVQKNSSMTRQRYAKHNKPPAAKGKK